MNNLQLSSADLIYLNNNIYTQKQKTINSSSSNEIKDGDKKSLDNLKWLGMIAAGSIAIGGTLLAIRSGKIKKAQCFFDDVLKTNKGNNKVITESIEESKTAIDELINNNKESYVAFKEKISNMLTSKNISEITPENYVYHGTSIDNARNILSDGITPFIQKKGGNELPGLGRAIYTTPTSELAKSYSSNGVVLPYKLEGNIAEYTGDADKFREPFWDYILTLLEPNAQKSICGKIYTEEAVELSKKYTPDFMNKVMQDLGYDALYTKCGTTKGLLSGLFGSMPKNIDNAGQVAVFNGDKLSLDLNKLKELNPIDKNNYYYFIK